MNELIDKWLSMKGQIDRWFALTVQHFFEPDNYFKNPDMLKKVNFSQLRPYFRVRAVAMYLMRKHVEDITLKEIGNAFGGQDHSTVKYDLKQVEIRYMHHVKKIEALAKSGSQEVMPLDE